MWYELCSVGLISRKHYRAIHGNFYKRWQLPEFIIKDEQLLREFLGIDAYAIYQSANLLLELIPIELELSTIRGASASCYFDIE